MECNEIIRIFKNFDEQGLILNHIRYDFLNLTVTWGKRFKIVSKPRENTRKMSDELEGIKITLYGKWSGAFEMLRVCWELVKLAAITMEKEKWNSGI